MVCEIFKISRKNWFVYFRRITKSISGKPVSLDLRLNDIRLLDFSYQNNRNAVKKVITIIK